MVISTRQQIMSRSKVISTRRGMESAANAKVAYIVQHAIPANILPPSPRNRYPCTNTATNNTPGILQRLNRSKDIRYDIARHSKPWQGKTTDEHASEDGRLFLSFSHVCVELSSVPSGWEDSETGDTMVLRDAGGPGAPDCSEARY